ncbi:hypothetical protein P9G84_31215 [Brevibacillus centrosporus]|uniref:hypothetical protein n=1 Tax=Brevibacillus centrosporus TaxID=54910 RepID=UPI001144D594|nr:hypothetical protein [Brevibacillus centrosporus]MEC2133328.1 hypothetical protein [Brevibacillus centrosporus]GED33915.1 hypothetical protein BCE02nite_50560 [Brevibacillus centrosporus]
MKKLLTVIKGLPLFIKYPQTEMLILALELLVSYLLFCFGSMALVELALKLGIPKTYIKAYYLFFQFISPILTVITFVIVVGTLVIILLFHFKNRVILTDLTKLCKEAAIYNWTVVKKLDIHLDGPKGLKALKSMDEPAKTKYFLTEFIDTLEFLKQNMETDERFKEYSLVSGRSPKIRPYLFEKAGIKVVKRGSWISKVIVAFSIATAKKTGFKDFFYQFSSNYRNSYCFTLTVDELKAIDVQKLKKIFRVK